MSRITRAPSAESISSIASRGSREPQKYTLFFKESKEKYFFGLFKRRKLELYRTDQEGVTTKVKGVALRTSRTFKEVISGDKVSFQVFQKPPGRKTGIRAFSASSASLRKLFSELGANHDGNFKSVKDTTSQLTLGQTIQGFVQKYFKEQIFNSSTKVRTERDKALEAEREAVERRSDDFDEHLSPLTLPSDSKEDAVRYTSALDALGQKRAEDEGSELNRLQSSLFHDYGITCVDTQEEEISKIRAYAEKTIFNWQES